MLGANFGIVMLVIIWGLTSGCSDSVAPQYIRTGFGCKYKRPYVTTPSCDECWWLIWTKKYSIVYNFILFPRKSWRPSMRCQSWSEEKHFQHSADMEGEHSSCPWLCSRVFSRISSWVVMVECHFIFQGILLNGCYFVEWCRPQFPHLQVQRTLPEENCLFTEQAVYYFPDIVSFLPKRMFNFLISAVFISVMFMWIYFIRLSGQWAHGNILSDILQVSFWGYLHIFGCL